MNDWEAPSSDGSKETLTCLSRAGEAQLDGGRRWVIEGERRHPHQMSRARHTWQRLPEAGGVGGPCVHKPNANTGGTVTHTHVHRRIHRHTHAVRVRSQKMSLAAVLVNITWAAKRPRNAHVSPGSSDRHSAIYIDPFWHRQTIPQAGTHTRTHPCTETELSRHD